jgi:hypothetical protein
MVPAHGTANGIARYGYGYGYGYRGWGWGWGYPYWGWYYPWWGVGFYGYWGWPGYYDGGAGYYYDGGGYAPAPHGPATIETAISPSHAEVILDGESVGYASDYSGRWDKLRVPAGKHTITFQSAGYRSLTIELDARPGADYTFRDQLAPGSGEDHRSVAPQAAPPPEPQAEPPQQQQDGSAAPSHAASGPTGRLRVHVEPGDAAVYLDGEYLGMGIELARVHGALAVPVGTHKLEAVRPGYVTATRTIQVGESELATADLTLEAQH